MQKVQAVIQSRIRPLSDMPRRHEECDHVVEDFVSMGKEYRTLCMGARVIGMSSEHPGSVIFLHCARPESSVSYRTRGDIASKTYSIIIIYLILIQLSFQ